MTNEAESTLVTHNDTFPRQYARTQRLSLGEPRSFTLSPCSQRLVFARTASGSDTVNMLWVLNTQTGEEQCAFNPQAVLDNTGNYGVVNVHAKVPVVLFHTRVMQQLNMRSPSLTGNFFLLIC
jgi:hypothetical protein